MACLKTNNTIEQRRAFRAKRRYSVTGFIFLYVYFCDFYSGGAFIHLVTYTQQEEFAHKSCGCDVCHLLLQITSWELSKSLLGNCRCSGTKCWYVEVNNAKSVTNNKVSIIFKYMYNKIGPGRDLVFMFNIDIALS